MKYRIEVHTLSCADGAWTGNAMVYEAPEEAKAAAISLFSRWMAVEYWRTIDEDGNVIDTNENA